jgi:hypothetical protein
MRRTVSEERARTEFGEAAQAMHQRLRAWRRAHPDATFDELAEQVGQERKALVGKWLAELTDETEAVARVPVCPEWGGAVANKGQKKRQVLHGEGKVQVARAYYDCPACRQGVFPSGPQSELESAWLESSDDAAGVAPGGGNPLLCACGDQLQRVDGGSFVGKRLAAADGVLIHLREEGWKEVKVMSVSAVRPANAQTSAAEGRRLAKHSYRAGLWDAKHFTPPYWAESARRGVEKAKQIVCISDGAAWIWAMVLICFARRIEVLDWRHVLRYLWQIVGAASELTAAEATAWMDAQKAALAHSRHRLLLRNIRLRFPRAKPLLWLWSAFGLVVTWHFVDPWRVQRRIERCTNGK